MPPAYVKPYVKRRKNDAADAGAICEAVTRANMRFVETKTPEQQSCLMLHRTRQLFIRQQTSVINAIRALALSHHGPSHSGDLVGKRDGGDLGRRMLLRRRKASVS
jgi:transposase